MTRLPDYYLALATKDGSRRKGRIGAAWMNGQGGITISLNPGTTLNWKEIEDCYLTLWPNQDAERDLEEDRRGYRQKPRDDRRGQVSGMRAPRPQVRRPDPKPPDVVSDPTDIFAPPESPDDAEDESYGRGTDDDDIPF